MTELFAAIMQLIWPILVALGGAAVFLYGRKKKAQGVAEEKDRSRKVVKKVQDEMNRETRRDRTTEETADKLRKGKF